MYQFVVFLLRPFTLLFLGLLAVTFLVWRRPPMLRRRALIGQGIVLGLVTLACLPPIGYVALLSLEYWYPREEDVPQDIDTIVVLAGGLTLYDDAGKQYELTSDSLLRCLFAAKLYRQADGCRIIASGGKVDFSTPGPTLAQAMREFFIQAGVKPSDIMTEEVSRTTYENALHTREILDKLGVKRIVLVTDATHMWRASRCFKRQGIEVIPRPCNHHAGYFRPAVQDFFPSSGSAQNIEIAAHEWLGLIWYWLKRRI